jgi:hypothetical protein
MSMKRFQLVFFAASAILAAALSACLNPVDFTRVMIQDGGGDGVLPAGTGGADGNAAGGNAEGGPAGLRDTASFTVTIPVNPKPGRAAAGLGGGAIQLGGARNTFLLAVLDPATGKIADSAAGSRLNDGELSRDTSVSLFPGKYGFLVTVNSPLVRKRCSK